MLLTSDQLRRRRSEVGDAQPPPAGGPYLEFIAADRKRRLMYSLDSLLHSFIYQSLSFSQKSLSTISRAATSGSVPEFDQTRPFGEDNSRIGLR
jgi:hypothetical protein